MTRPTASDPPWLQEAWQHLGQKEIPGPRSNLWIEKLWLARPGGRWFWEHFGRDDSKLPWCGAFSAHCFATKGMQFPRHYQRALAWAEWGKLLDRPAHGCVVVFGRVGGGHVGFVVGENAAGDLLVICWCSAVIRTTWFAFRCSSAAPRDTSAGLRRRHSQVTFNSLVALLRSALRRHEHGPSRG